MSFKVICQSTKEREQETNADLDKIREGMFVRSR